MHRNTCRLAVFLLAASLVVAQAWAAITGSISGQLTDATGAALPGVKVTATNEETQVAQTVETDTSGNYTFTALNVGSYTVSVAYAGFKEYKAEHIKIDANSALRIPVALTVGAVTDTEQVNADAYQVETENTQLGQVIESQKIEAVPLNGRAFTDLLALQPGVSPYKSTSESGRTVSGGLNTGNQSVNGGREASNGFMVNGADANEGVFNGAGLIPNLDSIAEFRIITNNFDAEYGNFSGGQINVVTKAGTNNIHGDAFNFLRNTDLDAKNYYASDRGVFIQNIFGGTLGAPVMKDRAFFFVDFQGTKQIKGATQNYHVPTTADREGQLTDVASQLTGTVNGAAWAQSLSSKLGYAVTAGEPYYASGCTVATCVFPNALIPAAAWSPAATGTLKYIPAANAADSYYATAAYSAHLSDYKGSLRGDLTTRFGNLFAYYFRDTFNVTDPYQSVSVPGFAASNAGTAQMANVGVTSIMKNNTVNDARVSYLRIAYNLGTPVQGTGVTLASLGFTSPWGASGGVSAINSATEGVPTMYYNNFSLGTPAQNLGQYNNNYQALDTFTKVIGRHTLKGGGSYHYDQINERNFYGANGIFSFTGQETGSDFADYLLGAPANFTQASAQNLDSRSHYAGAFAQDSYKIIPNLTLNLGIRWEVSTPWYDTQNKLEAIIPGVQSVVFPGAPKGYLVPGDPGVPRTLAPVRWNNFAPRFGFAYSPATNDGFLSKITGGRDKFSVRGGYGVFYTNIQDATGFVEVGDAPYGLFYSSPVPSRFETPFIDRATGKSEGQRFPFNFPPTNVSASNPDTTFDWSSVLPIAGSLVFDTKNVLPYTQSFYIGAQRELSAHTILTLNYVGNVGRKLLTEEESNPGDPTLCQSLTTAALAPGQTACGPNLETNVYTLANGTTVNGTRTTLGIDFGSNPYMRTSASSSYNSLQATLQHTSSVAEFLIGYTYGKAIDNSSGQGDYTNVLNPKLSRGLSNFDIRHNFVASYTVHLPFQKLTDGTGIANAIAKGWAVSGITTLATGRPITMQETDDYSLTGTGYDLPDYTAGKLSGDHNPRHGNAYFNTALFTQETYGSFGTSRRRFFSGPGLNNTDMALLRDFGWGEHRSVQFRAEAFNVFNHAQFNNPSGNWNNQGVGGFGYVTSANDPRIMQVALKVLF